MAAWLRIFANPKVLKRFLSTHAGKQATLKYGKMLLNSKMAKNAIEKFISRDGAALADNRDYAKLSKEYHTLQKRVAKIESRLERARDDDEDMSELTFALGRNVIEMRRILTQMQSVYQYHTQQIKIAMANSED